MSLSSSRDDQVVESTVADTTEGKQLSTNGRGHWGRLQSQVWWRVGLEPHIAAFWLHCLKEVAQDQNRSICILPTITKLSEKDLNDACTGVILGLCRERWEEQLQEIEAIRRSDARRIVIGWGPGLPSEWISWGLEAGLHLCCSRLEDILPIARAAIREGSLHWIEQDSIFQNVQRVVEQVIPIDP